MNELRKNHAIAYSALAVAAGMIIALLVDVLTEAAIAAGAPGAFSAASAILVKITPIIVAVVFLALTGKLGLIRPRAAGFGRGLACGAPLLALFCLMGLYALANVVEGDVQFDGGIVAKALFYFLLVGIGEEFLARAVAAETLLEHFGTTHAGIVKACVVSGVIFGAMHVVNLFGGMDPAGVVVQMLSTAGAGMVFAAIYFRCGNLWATVVLHALWDASLLAATVSSKGVDAVSSAGGGNPAGSIVFLVVLVLIALFLLRKKKTAQVQQAWADAIEPPASPTQA